MLILNSEKFSMDSSFGVCVEVSGVGIKGLIGVPNLKIWEANRVTPKSKDLGRQPKWETYYKSIPYL